MSEELDYNAADAKRVIELLKEYADKFSEYGIGDTQLLISAQKLAKYASEFGSSSIGLSRLTVIELQLRNAELQCLIGEITSEPQE